MRKLVFALVVFAGSNQVYSQQPQQSHYQPMPEPPEVQITSQPDAPLRITSIKTKWAGGDHSGVELYIVVENFSEKAVSSYTTRDDNDVEGTRACMLMSAPSPGKVLRPGQSEGRSTWRHYSTVSETLARKVDFVEFADGTTWGPDSCSSAISLDGRRAGARAARKLLQAMFASGGADGVIDTLKQGLLRAQVPPHQSQVWQNGFAAGFEIYLHRIRDANERWGFTEIEHALSRPIDAVAQ